MPSTASSGEMPIVSAQFPNRLALGVSPVVDHLRQPHRLQAVRAAHAGGELPQHHVAQGPVDRHPFVVAERRRGLLAGQFGQAGCRSGFGPCGKSPSACR